MDSWYRSHARTLRRALSAVGIGSALLLSSTLPTAGQDAAPFDGGGKVGGEGAYAEQTFEYGPACAQHGAAAVGDADIEALRAHGFDIAQLWEATFTAAFFNFVTRMADAFGFVPLPERAAQVFAQAAEFIEGVPDRRSYEVTFQAGGGVSRRQRSRNGSGPSLRVALVVELAWAGEELAVLVAS